MRSKFKSFSLTQIISWKFCLPLTIGLIPILIVLNFYGLYSNKFYLLKVDNYIFPIVSVLHLLYLYAIWFKIKERDFPDPQLRNLEYVMYAVLLIYIFKLLDLLYILLSYNDYKEYLISSAFLPVGITTFLLYLVLIFLLFTAFEHRRKAVGIYNFDQISEDLDSWS